MTMKTGKPMSFPKNHSIWAQIREVDFMDVWTRGIKGVLSLMIITLLAALAVGVIKTFFDLLRFADQPAEDVLRRVIIQMLILLALVEVFKTATTYFSEGRVKVTFIVDTILVVMLTEVLSHWFRGGDWRTLGALGGVLLTLGIVRVMVVRWSPTPVARSTSSYMTQPHEGDRT